MEINGRRGTAPSGGSAVPRAAGPPPPPPMRAVSSPRIAPHAGHSPACRAAGDQGQEQAVGISSALHPGKLAVSLSRAIFINHPPPNPPRAGVFLGARQPAACYTDVSACIACTYQEIRLGRGAEGGEAGNKVQM